MDNSSGSTIAIPTSSFGARSRSWASHQGLRAFRFCRTGDSTIIALPRTGPGGLKILEVYGGPVDVGDVVAWRRKLDPAVPIGIDNWCVRGEQRIHLRLTQ